MNDCVICKIVSGSIPARIVHRDSQVICFFPKEVEAYGHTVIAPVNHYSDIFDATEDSLGMLMTSARTLALHYRERTGASGINLLHASGASAQQSVGHIHLHLIPRFDGDDLDAWPAFPRPDLNMDEMREELQVVPQVGRTDLRP